MVCNHPFPTSPIKTSLYSVINCVAGVYSMGRVNYPPKIYYPYAQTPVAHAIAAHILTTVAMARGCKCPRPAIVAK